MGTRWGRRLRQANPDVSGGGLRLIPRNRDPGTWSDTRAPAITAPIGVVVVLAVVQDVEEQVDDLVELDRAPDVRHVVPGSCAGTTTTWRNHLCTSPLAGAGG